MARTYLYLENWDEARNYAEQALKIAGITTLTNDANAYKALYNSEISNSESMFALAITNTTNWSANSYGTLWSTYNFSPSPKLISMYATNDCRKILIDGRDKTSTESEPVYTGGKIAHFSSGNPARGTNYIVNAPEMYLIKAEANVQLNKLNEAKEALLVVAKRNLDIKSTNDLPSEKENLMSFIKDERARELFQEGMRLYDLRRWNERVSVYANSAPAIKFTYTNYEISNLVFPIPSAEQLDKYSSKINNHIFYFERKMLFKGCPNTQEHPFKTNIGHSLCKYIVCANRLIHQHLPFNFIRKKRFPANPSYQNQV